MPVKIECNGVTEERMVPIAEYPGAPLFAPIFPRPGILVGRPPSEEIPDIKYQVLTPAPLDHEERLKKLRGDGPTRAHVEVLWNLNPVMCLLAKIGHGFAMVAHADSFTSVLPDYILDRDRRLLHVIGSTEQVPVRCDFSEGGTRRAGSYVCSRSRFSSAIQCSLVTSPLRTPYTVRSFCPRRREGQ